MSSVKLLDSTRKITAILHKKNSGKVVFNDICGAMKTVLASNVFVFSKKGKLLGFSNSSGIPIIGEMIPAKVGEVIDNSLNDRLTDILSTKENVNLETLGFSAEVAGNYQAIITPINIAGERYGTILIYRPCVNADFAGKSYDEVCENYSIDDIILCEYGATVVGLEMVRSVSEESAEEIRKMHGVKSALGTMSTSEIEAVRCIFEELNGCEGVLVASKIADSMGITRSVIVNALRKLESAGVVEARSSGMKGTYIKVVNPMLYDALKELKNLDE